ncbi:MAG: hypothetical protein OEX00_01850 [Gammaproteobacteria bacterium]|nr:hypothetical protein [Gammaproteobacteria bacterium]MDH5692897.1 hypothetical protein [Gammaproteobacteria bacterium]
MSQEPISKLTPKQLRALPLLASGMVAKEVALTVNVSQVQISNWKKNEEFMEELGRARKEVVRETETRLVGLAIEAVSALGDLMKNARSESSKLRAAIYLIERVGFQVSLDGYGKGGKKGIDMDLLLTALGAKEEERK